MKGRFLRWLLVTFCWLQGEGGCPAEMNPPDPAARVPLSLLRLCAPGEGPGELPDAGRPWDAGTDRVLHRDCLSLRPGGGQSTSAKISAPRLLPKDYCAYVP